MTGALAAERAHRAAMYTAILGAVGLAFDCINNLAIGRAALVEGIAIPPILVLLAVLVWRDDRPSVRFGIAALLACNALVIAALWVSQQVIAESGVPWVPFRPNHLGALTAAMLAPGRMWVGILTVTGFTGAALAQYSLFDPSIRDRLPFGDPWATIAFGGFGLGVLLFRRRASRVEHDSIDLQVRMKNLERFARTMLAVRDLTNTPLQTLKLSADLLRADKPPTRLIADRVDGAVRRLQEIDRIAATYDRDLPWPPDSESIAAIDVLDDVATRSTWPTPSRPGAGSTNR
jgi:hypothetical protein